jgi:hypothetical protein
MLPLVLARFSLRHPRLTAAALVLTTLVLAFGTTRLRSDVGYRAFLGESHPVIRELDGFLARFGGGLPMLAVWSCAESPACDSAFDPSALRMAHDVAGALARIDGVRRVDSPATSPLLAPVLLEPFPRARRLAAGGAPVEDLDELAAVALEDPLWVGQLVSEKGDAGAVIVHLRSSDGGTSLRVFDALQRATAPWEEKGFRFHFVGGPVEFVVAGRELERNTAYILPAMVGLIWLVLVVLFGSWFAVTLSLAAVGLAVVWTLGAAGWLGWPQNSLSQALAPLILVIGVCDSIHLLTGHVARLGGRAPVEAMLAASREVGPACLMTTLTTAAGFASFASSPLQSIARFGLLATWGVCASLLLTFTILPPVVVRLPRRALHAPAHEAGWRRFLQSVAFFAERRRFAVLAAAALLGALSAAGAARLTVDASFETLYGEQSHVVRWAHAVARVLREPDTLEISVEPPEADTTLPRALAVADRIEARLAGLDGLGRSRSLVDPLRRLNSLVHSDPLVLDGATDRKGRPGSLLRLMRAADEDVIDLLYDARGGALRISTEARKLPQERLRALLATVRERVDGALPQGWHATITGPLAVVGRMIDAIRSTQLRSFALAAVIVFVSVVVFFRSWSHGALAMLPTLLPVLLTLGAMGFAGIALDVGSAMVAAVVLGLAVDNAIHLVARHRQLREAGRSRRAAIEGAVLETGRPIATTAVALSAGFFTLILSSWNSIASFGLISALAIGSALVAALLILPAVLGGGAGDER